MGRIAGSECFGFSGNVTDDSKDKPSLKVETFAQAIASLEERGKDDVLRVAGCGIDPKNRYFYTMVLDSDTICPPNSIRTLVETAEHPTNRCFGLINANLANDYGSDDKCTWHMWRNALMEVSTVNLQRGQFWIFNRVGFYGKGLIRNDTYISRLIGTPGNLIEALPVDILSHDTVEAKLLQPAVASGVTLYEDVARNPISQLSQSTRWMLGEVRNGCYHSDGFYTPLISFLSRMYVLLTKCERRDNIFIRWKDVPCSASAEYLSHTGFRLFHAGPSILLINMAISVLAQNKWGLELVTLPVVGQYVLLFTVLALFLIPKGFLILDKLPSMGLGRYLLCTRKASKIGDGCFNDEDSPAENDEYGGNAREVLIARDSDHDLEDSELDDGSSDDAESVESEAEEQQKLNRCSVLLRQLVLALIEISFSLLLFSPELIIGVIRLFRGAWAQVTGTSSWQPQDAVEREVEESLSVWYVFKKTWIVFVCGILYLSYVISVKIHDPFVFLLIVSWILYPITTYVMCLPVPKSCKTSWIWTWVMDIKRAEMQ